MSSLFASLALSGTLAASVLGGETPPAPELPESSISSEENTVRSATGSSSEEEIKVSGLNGIDISGHQHNPGASINIDELMNSEAINYAFVKATEGTGYVNPHFRDDYVDFIENDAVLGSYHYAKPSESTEDARKQARIYLSVTGINDGVKSMDPVLDIEEDEGVGTEDLINWVDAFVDEIQKESGRDTIIYTYPSFWKDKMGNTDKFNDLDLWIAEYNGKNSPSELPGGWDDYLFWQYSSEGSVDGYSKNIDLNIFHGTQEELDSLYYRSDK